MPSDPPLHVALGPDLRRPSVRLLKVIPCNYDQSLVVTDTNTPSKFQLLLLLTF